MSSESNKERQEEYMRWHDYANVLLIASTVLLAGTSIALPKELAVLTLLSALGGLAAILLTVLWFAQEYAFEIREKPGFLFLASCAFGFQIGFLFGALVVGLF